MAIYCFCSKLDNFAWFFITFAPNWIVLYVYLLLLFQIG